VNWKILNPLPAHVQRLEKEFSCSEIIARVMANRGVESLKQSQSFFSPSLSELHDPFLMKDMDIAVERIIQNIKNNIPILVFGDYDVDGTTGAAMLTLALSSVGAEAIPYIPDREKEGYGLSEKGIKYAHSIGATLIITCDCGINAHEMVEFANSLEINVIITDHHVPGDTLPAACAVLNPKRYDCTYPFKGLCGGGVALKLMIALMQKMDIHDQIPPDWLCLISLGTAADMVPMIEENRVIVHHGLINMPYTKQPGLKALLTQEGFEGKVPTVGQLVFWIAPKINAAGRLGDAGRSVELLTTTDKSIGIQLAHELRLENDKRRTMQEIIVDDAIHMVNAQFDLSRDFGIVLAHREWHQGIIGIVASKIKEQFNRPVIVISIGENGIGRGSARSIAGFDMYNALDQSSEWLEGFGGHPMAAGLSIMETNLESFTKVFLDYVKSQIEESDLNPTLVLDGNLNLSDINGRFMAFLDKLGPHGPMNMRPKFSIKNIEVKGTPKVLGPGGDHLKFSAKQSGRTYPAIAFNMSHCYEKLICGTPLDIAVVIEENKWKGNTTIQLNVRDIIFHA
jgi:single-stranded-DNA-specific exonuclease|tara:strand:+ start:185 stop:1888 length:1704 start_codon:yes stop_codon:yes gene_type:complete